MNHLIYAVPLVVAFSLCYAGTRHEDLGSIFRHAARFAGWTVFFMILVILLVEWIVRFVKA